MNILYSCSPRHLLDVATLRCEIQKGHFKQYYSYTLLIIYVNLLTDLFKKVKSGRFLENSVYIDILVTAACIADL